MRHILTIPERLPALNVVINESKRHWSRYSKTKAVYSGLVAMIAGKAKPIAEPAHLLFVWREPNKKRDPDNISFAQKYILDGMVKAGILKGDGWASIASLSHRFIHTPGTASVEVWEITENEK